MLTLGWDDYHINGCFTVVVIGTNFTADQSRSLDFSASLSRPHWLETRLFQSSSNFNAECPLTSALCLCIHHSSCQNWCNKTIFSGDTVSAFFRCLSEGPRNDLQHCLGTFLGTAMGHFVAQIEQQSAQSALSLVVINCEILENEQKWPKATQCLVKQAAVVPASS